MGAVQRRWLASGRTRGPTGGRRAAQGRASSRRRVTGPLSPSSNSTPLPTTSFGSPGGLRMERKKRLTLSISQNCNVFLTLQSLNTSLTYGQHWRHIRKVGARAPKVSLAKNVTSDTNLISLPFFKLPASNSFVTSSDQFTIGQFAMTDFTYIHQSGWEPLV